VIVGEAFCPLKTEKIFVFREQMLRPYFYPNINVKEKIYEMENVCIAVFVSIMAISFSLNAADIN